ncbi:MAG TPA: patatin-like phospholipase family protein [Longimicrobium sp.]|jgi:NTE family protein
MSTSENESELEERASDEAEPILDPVRGVVARAQGEDEPQPGVGLCLSGGGYRAMLFHLGALWRLNEIGWLPRLNRVSSVSGGSITAGVLACAWNELGFQNGVAPREKFEEHVVGPLRRLAEVTIDEKSVLTGILLPGASIADRVAKAYREHLFGRRTLQDLPDEGPGTPRFVFNATNVQTGSLWRFSKKYMADHQVGQVKNPTIQLAVAVAASSAFPPVLSPMVMKLPKGAVTAFDDGTVPKYAKAPFTTRVVLTDGGVYDNMGLETIWKNYQTVLVSDGGQEMDPEAEPHADWAHHALRVNALIDHQVRSLRRRQVVGSLVAKHRSGAFWPMSADIYRLSAPHTLPCAHDQTLKLAATPTRLRHMDATLQERLINWGYAICDASMRSFVDTTLSAPPGFPYPGSGVG